MEIKPGNNKGEVYSKITDLKVVEEREHCDCSNKTYFFEQIVRDEKGKYDKQKIAKITNSTSCFRQIAK